MRKKTWWWLWEFPLTGHHCNICIYSNQQMNTVHGGKQRQANGRAASLLRAPKQPPVSQQHPGRDTGKWCGNREAPRAGQRGGEPLVARGELAFYLCPFSSVISAPPLQPQMANMEEGLAFVSKMMIKEVFFHPERDISSHSVTDSLMPEMLEECTEYLSCFHAFFLLSNVDKKKGTC